MGNVPACFGETIQKHVLASKKTGTKAKNVLLAARVFSP
jgi:hypothetical protein